MLIRCKMIQNQSPGRQIKKVPESELQKKILSQLA